MTTSPVKLDDPHTEHLLYSYLLYQAALTALVGGSLGSFSGITCVFFTDLATPTLYTEYWQRYSRGLALEPKPTTADFKQKIASFPTSVSAFVDQFHLLKLFPLFGRFDFVYTLANIMHTLLSSENMKMLGPITMALRLLAVSLVILNIHVALPRMLHMLSREIPYVASSSC